MVVGKDESRQALEIDLGSGGFYRFPESCRVGWRTFTVYRPAEVKHQRPFLYAPGVKVNGPDHQKLGPCLIHSAVSEGAV